MAKNCFSEGFIKPTKDGGIKRAGDNAAISHEVVGTILKLLPPKGEYNGVNSKVTLSNYLNTLGVKRFASGTLTTNASNLASVSGLAFRPDKVILAVSDATFGYNFGITVLSNQADLGKSGYTLYSANTVPGAGSAGVGDGTGITSTKTTADGFSCVLSYATSVTVRYFCWSA